MRDAAGDELSAMEAAYPKNFSQSLALSLERKNKHGGQEYVQARGPDMRVDFAGVHGRVQDHRRSHAGRVRVIAHVRACVRVCMCVSVRCVRLRASPAHHPLYTSLARRPRRT